MYYLIQTDNYFKTEIEVISEAYDPESLKDELIELRENDNQMSYYITNTNVFNERVLPENIVM